jgi:hypothetical protein
VAVLQILVGEAEIPWDVSSRSLRIKTYAAIRPKRQVSPPRARGTAYAIDAVADGILPEYEGLGPRHRRITSLCAELDELTPEDAYAAARAKLVREPQAWTFAGGIPRWLQGEDAARDDEELVLQIGSSGTPPVLWGDSGVAYLFRGRGGFRWCIQSL